MTDDKEELETPFFEPTQRERCVLCENYIPHPAVLHGMNPWPLATSGKCCRECNKKVISARVIRGDSIHNGYCIPNKEDQ